VSTRAGAGLRHQDLLSLGQATQHLGVVVVDRLVQRGLLIRQFGLLLVQQLLEGERILLRQQLTRPDRIADLDIQLVQPSRIGEPQVRQTSPTTTIPKPRPSSTPTPAAPSWSAEPTAWNHTLLQLHQ